MLPCRIRSLADGIRGGAVPGAIGEAAGRAGTGSSSPAAGISSGGLLVLLDDIFERHVQGARRVHVDETKEKERERRRAGVLTRSRRFGKGRFGDQGSRGERRGKGGEKKGEGVAAEREQNKGRKKKTKRE